MYKFLGKNGKYYIFDPNEIIMKLNFNCPKSYKDGEGEGSCKGYKPGNNEPKKSDKNNKESSKLVITKSIKIENIKDYKSASPENQLKFLQDEMAKGKRSTFLPDGTYINNIKSKATALEKKIGVASKKAVTQTISPETKKLVVNVKKTIAKVKKEKASGKVSKKTTQELKDSANNLKKSTESIYGSEVEQTSSSSPSKMNFVLKSKEVKSNKPKDRSGYEPAIYDSSKQYNKIQNITIGENNPGYIYQSTRAMGAEHPSITWREFTPISTKDIKPYFDEVNNILEKENLPPLSKLEIYTEEYPMGSASYDPKSLVIQMGQEILEKKYYDERMKDNKNYQKQNNIAYSAMNYMTNQKDAIRANLIHELAHHEMATYMKRNNREVLNNRITDGDTEWNEVLTKVSSEWKAPTKYSQATSGEMYAECVSLYTLDMKEKLHPDIIKYIEKVKSYNRLYKE